MSKSDEGLKREKALETFSCVCFSSMIFALLVTSTGLFVMFHNALMIISQLYHLCE